MHKAVNRYYREPMDAVGYIPDFLNLSDPRPAAEQFHTNYIGGWNSFKGFHMNPDDHTLSYSGDPDMPVLAEIPFRDETILIYPHSWVAITQPDDSYDIARMD